MLRDGVGRGAKGGVARGAEGPAGVPSIFLWLTNLRKISGGIGFAHDVKLIEILG